MEHSKDKAQVWQVRSMFKCQRWGGLTLRKFDILTTY